MATFIQNLNALIDQNAKNGVDANATRQQAQAIFNSKIKPSLDPKSVATAQSDWLKEVDYALGQNKAFQPKQELSDPKITGSQRYKKNFNDFYQSGMGLNAAKQKAYEQTQDDLIPDRGVLGHAKDIGIDALKGAIGLPEAFVGIGDLVTGGGAGRVAESVGFRPAEAKAVLDEYYTPARQEANAKVNSAQGFLPTLKAMIDNPSTIGGAAIVSAPSMLGGGVISRGALKLAPKVGGIVAGAMGEGFMAAGQNAAQVRQNDAEGKLTAEQAAIIAASGGLTGLIGFGSGKIANHLGVGDLQTMMAQGRIGVATAEGAAAGANKSLVRKVAEGAALEGIGQEMPQSYQEQVAQNIAQDKPWDEGAGAAAAQGLLVGAATGGIVGSLSNKTQQNTQIIPSDSVDPADGDIGRKSDNQPFLNLKAAQLFQRQNGLADSHDLVQLGRGQRFVLRGKATQEEAPVVVPDDVSTEAQPIQPDVPSPVADQSSQVDPISESTPPEPTIPPATGLAGIVERAQQRTTDTVQRIRARQVAETEALKTQFIAAAQGGNAELASQIAQQAVEQHELPIELVNQWQAELGQQAQNQADPAPNANPQVSQFDPSVALNIVEDAKRRSALEQQSTAQNSVIEPSTTPDLEVVFDENGVGHGVPKSTTAEQASPVPTDEAQVRQQFINDFANAHAAQIPNAKTPLIEETIKQGIPRHKVLSWANEAVSQVESTPEPVVQEQEQSLPSTAESIKQGMQEISRGMGEGAREQVAEYIREGKTERLTYAKPEAVEAALNNPDYYTQQNDDGSVTVVGVKDSQDDWVGVSPEQQASSTSIVGEPIDNDWTAFHDDSGTLRVPRSEMPQIKAEHRGPMVNFLNARGITHEHVEVPASDLKPTQHEFSPAKVEQAKGFTDSDRSILISSDGHVLDGHHQWLAKQENGAPIKAIRLNAPISELLSQVKEFPSVQTAEGSPELQPAPIDPNTMQQGDIGRKSDGQPFANKGAATLYQNKNGLKESHEMVQLGKAAQFVLRLKPTNQEQGNDVSSTGGISESLSGSNPEAERVGQKDEPAQSTGKNDATGTDQAVGRTNEGGRETGSKTATSSSVVLNDQQVKRTDPQSIEQKINPDKPAASRNVQPTQGLNTKQVRQALIDRFGHDTVIKLETAGKLEIIDQLGELPEGALNSIQAFHGSPYKFDQFSLKHLGRGDGHQLYGFGLYFSDSKDVSDFYRKNLAASNDDGQLYQVNIDSDGQDILNWEESLESQKAISDRLKPLQEHLKQQGVLDQYETALGFPFNEWNGGELYTVLKHAAKNKVLPQQSIDVLEAVEMGKPDKAASLYLHSLGINGLKYAQSARDGVIPSGSSNYVIFDDSAIQITDTFFSQNPNGIEGYYHNGKITLVASNLTADTVIPAFLHEVGGHAGMQGLMKPGTYDAIMQQFDQMVKVGNPLAMEAKRRAEVETDPAVQQQEYLPYLISVATEAQAAGDGKGGAYQAVQRFIQRITNAIKAWVVDVLGVPLKLNPDDVVALAERMVQRVAKSPGQQNGKQQFSQQEEIKFGQREGLFDLPDIPIVKLSGKEFGESFKDTKAMADHLLRDLQAAPLGALHNNDTNWDLTISGKDRKKMGDNRNLSHPTSQAVAGLTDLVSNAVLAETHQDNKHSNPDVKAVHRLYAPVQIGDTLYRVKLTVKQYEFTTGQPSSKNLHAIEAVELEKENALLGTLPSYSTSNNDVQKAQPTTGHSLSIAQLLSDTIRDGDVKPFGTVGNDKPLFSRRHTDFEGIPQSPAQAKAWAKQRLKEDFIQGYPLRRSSEFIRYHMATPLHLSLTEKEFKPVFELIQERMNHVAAESSYAMEKAPELLGRRENLKDFGLEAKNAVSKVGGALGVGSNKYQTDMEAAGKALFDGTRIDEKVYSDDELTREGLTPDQIKRYREMRAAIDTSLEQAAKTHMSIVAKVEDIFLSNQIHRLHDLDLPINQHRTELEETLKAVRHVLDPKDPLDARIIKRIDKALSQIDEIAKKTEHLQATGYAPMMRFGDYVLYVGDKATGETALYEMFETERERNRALESLKQAGVSTNKYEISTSIKNPDEYKMFREQGINPETLALFGKEAGLDQDATYQAYLKLATAPHSALRRMIHRKGIAGFSENAERVVSAFVISNARRSANLLYNQDVENAVMSIHQGDLQNYAQRLMEYTQNPQEEMAGLRSFLFFMNMGFSFRYGLLNLTQPYIQTLPELSRFLNAAQAGKLVLSSSAMAFKSLNNESAIPTEFKADYEMLKRKGLLDPQNIWALQGRERGRSNTGSVWDVVQNASGMIAQLTETVNRRTAMLAALRAAKSMGPDKLKAQGFDSPFDFASHIIKSTQGVMNKGNRPPIARGIIGAPVMVFRTFSIQYIEQMIRLFKNPQYGGNRDEMRRALLLIMLMLFGLAGATGLPFAKDLIDVYESGRYVAGSPVNFERDVQELLGKEVARHVLYGSANAIGFDMSGSTGMGDLLPATRMLHPDTGLAKGLLETGGATGGFVKNMMDGTEAAMRGEYKVAGQTMAPRAFGSLSQSYDIADTGEYRTKYGNKLVDGTAMDAALKALDLNPTGLAQQGRLRMLEREDVAVRDAAQKRFREQLIEARSDGDKERIKEIKADIKVWNESNPKYPVDISDSSVAKSVKRQNAAWQDRNRVPKGMEWMKEAR